MKWGVLLAVSSLIGTACSGPAADVRAPSPDGRKLLRIDLEADPAMIDPITYSELMAGDVLGNIYESFTGLDEGGNVIPALATSWEPHEDNKGFRFHLRPGVRFYSGRELTAHDVKWSLCSV